MNLPIDPQTKVGALLDAYPGIEDRLIALVPAFERLRNPILRKTVAKVATLEQAARIGNVSVRDLVRALREETGQGAALELLKESDGAPPSCVVRHEIDADEMLARGVHPVGQVKQFVASLRPGEAVRLSSGFRPEPLIDLMRRTGAQVWCSETAPGRYTTLFSR